MRKGRNRGEKREKRGVGGGVGERENKEKTVDYSGHLVIASSRPPERRLLERRTLVPTVTHVENSSLVCMEQEAC